MAWQGGFSGTGFPDRDAFRDWLLTQPRPAYDRVVIHNTDAPYIDPPVPPGQRVKNISVHYKKMGWSAGPDFFVFPAGVYLGSPLGKSVGCRGWNGNSFHVEAEGKYTTASGQDPNSHERAAVAWENMAWVTAELLDWMGWEADDIRVKFHREGNTTHIGCPGNFIHKNWFLEKVKSAMRFGPPYRPATPKPPVKATPKPPANKSRVVKKGMTGGYVPGLQQMLRELGYYTATIDGDFGPKTEAAVKAFQTAVGLLADGVVGPKTWEALEAALKEINKPKPAPKPEPPQRQDISGMHMSKKGRDLLKHFEGCPKDKQTGLAIPYDDRGSPAICYGHTNRSGTPPTVTPEMRLTMEECDEILARDLIAYEDRVKKSVKVPLFQHEFDALVSIAYNWGPGNLDRSVLLELVNSGQHKEAADRIRKILPKPDQPHWKGIARRRNAEADHYLGKEK